MQLRSRRNHLPPFPPPPTNHLLFCLDLRGCPPRYQHCVQYEIRRFKSKEHAQPVDHSERQGSMDVACFGCELLDQ
jgi:hypothetical protein